MAKDFSIVTSNDVSSSTKTVHEVHISLELDKYRIDVMDEVVLILNHRKVLARFSRTQLDRTGLIQLDSYLE